MKIAKVKFILKTQKVQAMSRTPHNFKTGLKLFDSNTDISLAILTFPMHIKSYYKLNITGDYFHN